jgi:hypothetical protein
MVMEIRSMVRYRLTEMKKLSGARNVLYLDLGGGFPAVIICKNALSYTLNMYGFYCVYVIL